MIKENIYIGTIMEGNKEIVNGKKGDCLEDNYYTVHEWVEVKKEMAVLYKCYENKYLQITPATKVVDVKLAELDMTNKTICTTPIIGEFIDENTLVPYYTKKELEESKNVRTKKLKEKILLDPRLPIGIQH